MKKLLFILSDFERGGIPRVTLNLLEKLDSTKNQIDVFCGNPHGIFKPMFEKCPTCSLLPPSPFLRAVMCHKGKEKGIFLVFSLLIKFYRAICARLLRFDYMNRLMKIIGKRLSKKKYDCVFATSEGFPADLALRVNCGKRYVWIHNDYANDSSVTSPGLAERLEGFDTILCVAEHARISVCNHFPNLSSKSVTLYNIVNEEEILEKANELSPEECYPGQVGTFKIVSVGRFNDAPKKFSQIPKICSELNKKGLKFKWYLIGNGSPAETAIIQKAIDDYQPGDSFVMLGEKSNPYPYIRHANLFAITSKYETYPTVVNEARALGTPVLATPFKGVDEVLYKNEGVIASIENFAETIANIMKHGMPVHEPSSFSEHNRKVLDNFLEIIEQG